MGGSRVSPHRLDRRRMPDAAAGSLRAGAALFHRPTITERPVVLSTRVSLSHRQLSACRLTHIEHAGGKAMSSHPRMSHEAHTHVTGSVSREPPSSGSALTTLDRDERTTRKGHDSSEDSDVRRVSTGLGQARRRRRRRCRGRLRRRGLRRRRRRLRSRHQLVVQVESKEVILTQREGSLTVVCLECDTLSGIEHATLGLVPGDAVGRGKVTLRETVTSVPRGRAPG